jgi:hypothetical protein
MPPRTPLGVIDGNRRFKQELTPYERGQIVGAVKSSHSFPDAAALVKTTPLTAKYTLRKEPERRDRES